MELWSLFSAHHLKILYICTKFHENISKGFLVIARTRNHDGRTDGQRDRRTDRQTDGQTDGQGDYYRAPPTSSGGALKRRQDNKFKYLHDFIRNITNNLNLYMNIYDMIKPS